MALITPEAGALALGIVLVLGGSVACWRIIRSLPPKPCCPEPSPRELLQHLQERKFYTVEGFAWGLPLQIHFPGLSTVLHVHEDWCLRMKTQGHGWTPVVDAYLSHTLQRMILSDEV